MTEMVVRVPAGWFGRNERADGSTFVALVDDAPAWVRDTVYTAHDDEAPNDWRYEACERIVGSFDEFAVSPGDRVPEDMRHTITDDVFGLYYRSADVLAWAAGNVTRPGYASDWYDEVGGPDPVSVVRDPLLPLRDGLWCCLRVMVNVWADAFEGVGEV
jgi:hypothetical protein